MLVVIRTPNFALVNLTDYLHKVLKRSKLGLNTWTRSLHWELRLRTMVCSWKTGRFFEARPILARECDRSLNSYKNFSYLTGHGTRRSYRGLYHNCKNTFCFAVYCAFHFVPFGFYCYVVSLTEFFSLNRWTLLISSRLQRLYDGICLTVDVFFIRGMFEQFF